MVQEKVIIDSRFRGPPDSGNGGYVCGRVANFIPGPAVVRLRVPPPLGVPLEVEKAENRVRLLHEGKTVAEGWGADIPVEVPDPPSLSEAEEASRGYRGFSSHYYPCCFVCGPDRAAGDGLRVFPGKLPGRDLLACPWVPDESLCDDRGMVLPEFRWAALDCPGGFAFPEPETGGILLGELGVRLSGEVRVGERCVLMGWEISQEGKKHFAGTALFSEDGECRGVGRATWIDVDLPGFD